MKSTAKMTKAELIAVINQLRHQVSELQGRLDIARRVYKDLRAELMAARAEQPKAEQPNSVVTMTDGFVDSAKATYQERCAEAERHAKAKASGKKERAIATFFNLKDAGEYIVELKRRGCKRSLFARRNAHNAIDIFVR